MPAKFYLPNLSSPTCHQLQVYLSAAGWQEGQDSKFSEFHLEFPELDVLEYKHRLAEFLAPDLTWMQPKTWCLDEDNWSIVLAKLAEEPERHPWILKPALLNNGQDIHLFSHLDDVVKHYLSPHRMGGPHVLQEYLHSPHLLQGPSLGHKYSLRLFVVITHQAAYLYPHGYFNIALKPYDLINLKSRIGHITNEHLQPGVYNVIQIPSWQYPMFQGFWPQIYRIFLEVSQKFLSNHHARIPRIGFLGMDLMVDASERVWLLEFNHGPCFPRDEAHPLYSSLYRGFWQAVVKEILARDFLDELPLTSDFVRTTVSDSKKVAFQD